MMSSNPLGSPPGNTVSLFPVLAQRFNAYFERLPRLHAQGEDVLFNSGMNQKT